MHHLGLSTTALDITKPFYIACLSVLGWRFRDYGVRGGAFVKEGRPTFYLAPSAAPTRGLHVAFSATSREQVDTFHRVAIEHGGRDHGEPGPRPNYGRGYYAAFVLDANDNNVEAVCFELELDAPVL